MARDQRMVPLEKLAQRLRDSLDSFPIKTVVPGKTPTGGSVKKFEEIPFDWGLKTSREILVSFIEFLENCGGFAVW